MNRKIIFRGKRPKDGRWVYGYYYAKPRLGLYFILEGENQWQVDLATIGQYTGLQDVNGTKIFEGDIVKAHDELLRRDEPLHEFTGTVGFLDASFVIADDCFMHYRWQDYEIKVVGNIHDKQEDNK